LRSISVAAVNSAWLGPRPPMQRDEGGDPLPRRPVAPDELGIAVVRALMREAQDRRVPARQRLLDAGLARRRRVLAPGRGSLRCAEAGLLLA
jgi:hypothetical protein